MTDLYPMGTILDDGNVYVCSRNYREGKRHIVLMNPQTTGKDFCTIPHYYSECEDFIKKMNKKERKALPLWKRFFFDTPSWEIPNDEELVIILLNINDKEFPFIQPWKVHFSNCKEFSLYGRQRYGKDDAIIVELDRYNHKALCLFIRRVDDAFLDQIKHKAI